MHPSVKSIHLSIHPSSLSYYDIKRDNTCAVVIQEPKWSIVNGHTQKTKVISITNT